MTKKKNITEKITENQAYRKFESNKRYDAVVSITALSEAGNREIT